MKRATHIYNTGIFWCMLFLATSVSAQSFRGEVVSRETVRPHEQIEISLSGGQIAVIQFDRSVRFIAAVAAEISSDSENARPGAFTLASYAGVDVPQREGVVDVAGRSLRAIPVRAARRNRVLLPVRDGAPPTEEAGQIVTEPIDPSVGAVAFQLVPIMKGMRDEDLAATYTLRVSAVLRSVGAIRIELTGDPDIVELATADLQMFLDGRPIEPNTMIERPPGIYRLRATAGDYISYTSNVGVEIGRLREIRLEAVRPQATVRLSVPSVAEVYWNGRLASDERELVVEPGTHSLMIRLGDFSVSRRLELAANESYEVGVDLDILLKQD